MRGAVVTIYKRNGNSLYIDTKVSGGEGGKIDFMQFVEYNIFCIILGEIKGKQG